MKILITGLSGSGKTTLAIELIKLIPNVTYLNGDIIRNLFNDWDFSPQSRLVQAKRMAGISDMRPNDINIADFICPTEETRRIFNADYVIFMNTIDSSPYADTDALYETPTKVDVQVTTKDAVQWAAFVKEDLRSKFPQLFDILPKT